MNQLRSIIHRALRYLGFAHHRFEEQLEFPFQISRRRFR
jgi:hypothetical protein